MCYDISYTFYRELKLAKRRGDDPHEIAEIEEKIRKFREGRQPKYHVSGFEHPELMVFTNEKPHEPQAFMWGLIPAWVKDPAQARQLYNQTLNARGETIFEKPAFKHAAIHKRCIIYVDGFFEHHHLGGKTYPFYIASKNDEPFALAGLWEEWVNRETGEVVPTVTIVTTVANSVMEKIHNNPKAEGPRMPVILTRENEKEWLRPCTNDEDRKVIQSLIQPYPADGLSYHPVIRLRGREAVGNIPAVTHKAEYPELALAFGY